MRSFADGNGDGIGDLAGVRARLAYLRDLGVDALWFTPWYPSPLADGGYDVADYRAIDPALRHARRGRGPHRRGRATWASGRSSTSSPTTSPTEHPWFQAALAAGPGSPERERFWFRPGRGEHGDEPPNGWLSELRRPGLDPHQEPRRHARRVVPPPVRARAARPQLGPPRRPPRARGHPAVLVRPRRRRRPHRLRRPAGQGPRPARGRSRPRARATTPTTTATSSTTSTAGWRALADAYDRAARAHRRDLAARRRTACARYLRPDEMHTAFNFDFLACPWEPARLRASIETTLARPRRGRRPGHLGAVQPRRHPPGDPLRPGGHRRSPSPPSGPACPPTSTSACAGPGPPPCWPWPCPGCVYIYQGEELGLPEVEDIPPDLHPGPDALPRPAASTPAATAAGCRCRGRATRRRSASARRARPPSRGCRSPPTGRP